MKVYFACLQISFRLPLASQLQHIDCNKSKAIILNIVLRLQQQTHHFTNDWKVVWSLLILHQEKAPLQTPHNVLTSKIGITLKIVFEDVNADSNTLIHLINENKHFSNCKTNQGTK